MKFSEQIKNIKARIFLNQDIDENEIFSIAINAKNSSDQASFDEASKAIDKTTIETKQYPALGVIQNIFK